MLSVYTVTCGWDSFVPQKQSLLYLTLQHTVCCQVYYNLLSPWAASTSTVKVVTIAALNDTHFMDSECKTSQQLPHFWVFVHC